MKLYISFGQSHTHSINGRTLDKDSIAGIECENYEDGRKKAFEYFNDKFAFDYSEDKIKDSLHYFPRGIIPINY